MKPRYVWVVEMPVDKKWEPCESASLSAVGARRVDLPVWKDANPNDEQ
jgi:hypothetical protein